VDRHEFLDALEGVKAEFSHYTFFADVYDAVRPKGTPKLHPGMLEEWPEEKALTALRFRHREAHGALGIEEKRGQTPFQGIWILPPPPAPPIGGSGPCGTTICEAA